MDSRTVHTVVYDTLADWEFGHATAHIDKGALAARPARLPRGHRRRRPPSR